MKHLNIASAILFASILIAFPTSAQNKDSIALSPGGLFPLRCSSWHKPNTPMFILSGKDKPVFQGI